MDTWEALRTATFRKKKVVKNQLMTIYGENLDENHVLSEYPRPQLRRDNYMILNGYWDYAFSKSGRYPAEFDGKILVPFSPESVLSGVNRQLKPSEYIFYERKIELEEIRKGERYLLHFGAVDQSCKVWLNGKYLGSHTGGYLPFSFDITEHLKKKNRLILRVSDDSDKSYHTRGKQMLKSGGMFYTAQSGIWQTVWMERVPQNYIKNIKITPMLDEKCVKVQVNTVKPVKKELEISALGIIIKTVETDSSTVVISLRDCTDVCTWTPESPFLYDLKIVAGDDVIQSYFAMRKFSVGKDKNGHPCLCLNNQPYYMHGVLDQGYYPDGLMTAPSDEAIRNDIDTMKKAGFNMIRKHLKIEPLRFYYHCDRYGMIVWQDMVNGGGKYNLLILTILPTLFPILRKHMRDSIYAIFARQNKRGRIEWIKECRRTVNYLYNCPSIAMWTLFNEGWGQFNSKKIVKIVKKDDKTRLVDAASGWVDQKCGDVRSLHIYFEKIKMKKDFRPVVLSEYGGYTCYIDKHSFSNQIYGYHQYRNHTEFRIAYKVLQKHIESLKAEGLAADVYTQLSDVEDEVNGILTYDRKINKLTEV